MFIALDRADKNFDHLHARLAKTIGGDEPLTKFVETAAPGVCRLADMRNYFEHPTKDHKTIVKNFHLLPDGKVSGPTWHLSGENPVSIGKDMLAAINFLVRVSEEMVIHLVMYRERERFTFSVQEIPANQIDCDFPMKYRVFTSPLKPPKAASPT